MTQRNDNIDKEIEEIIHKKDVHDDAPRVLKPSRPIYRTFPTSGVWQRLKKPLRWSVPSLLFCFLFFPMRHTVVLAGKVVPRDTVTIDARVGGVVLAVETANGATVRKGDVLVRIRDTAMAQEEARLQAEREVLREQLKGLKDEREEIGKQVSMHTQLYEAGEISRVALSVHETEFRKIENRLKIKEAELVGLNVRLRQTKENQESGTVISPVDGIVTTPIKQLLSTTLLEGEPVCEIAAGGWQFEFDVKENVFSSIELGSVLPIKLSAFPSDNIRARVDEIRPIVYEDRPQPWIKSNNARIVLSLVTPSPEGLRLGMTAKSSVLAKTRKIRLWRWWTEWRNRMS